MIKRISWKARPFMKFRINTWASAAFSNPSGRTTIPLIKWRQAEAQRTFEIFQYDRIPIVPKIVQLMEAIYENLPTETLLERCLDAPTQNSNESLCSCIWILAPKQTPSGKPFFEITTYLKVINFNDWFYRFCKSWTSWGSLWGLLRRHMCLNSMRNISTALSVSSVTLQKEPGFHTESKMRQLRTFP